MLLGDLPDAAIDAMIAVAGGSGPSAIVSYEVRHLGGAIGRRGAGARRARRHRRRLGDASASAWR